MATLIGVAVIVGIIAPQLIVLAVLHRLGKLPDQQNRRP